MEPRTSRFRPHNRFRNKHETQRFLSEVPETPKIKSFALKINADPSLSPMFSFLYGQVPLARPMVPTVATLMHQTRQMQSADLSAVERVGYFLLPLAPPIYYEIRFRARSQNSPKSLVPATSDISPQNGPLGDPGSPKGRRQCFAHLCSAHPKNSFPSPKSQLFVKTTKKLTSKGQRTSIFPSK